jgi:hypothetical protein
MRSMFFAAIAVLIAIATATAFKASAAEPADGGSLTVTLSWRTKGEQEARKTFPAMNVKKLAGKGLWLGFEPKGKQHLPGIFWGSTFRNIDTPLEELTALRLELRMKRGEQVLLKRRTIFDATRGFGFKKLSPRNVYHVLVLTEFADRKKLSAALTPKLPVPAWARAFARVRGLAVNYACRSDAESRKYEKILKVKADFSNPRLIMTAEEWLDVPKKVMVKKGGGGMFGALTAKLEATFKPVDIPTYTMDVLHNEVKVTGKYTIGFRSARSMHDDVLEGKVLAAATGGKRRVVTASVVFSQLRENVTRRKLKNSMLRVSSADIKKLDQCRHLYASERKSITGFLSANRDWQVLIPADPVIFFEPHAKKKGEEIPIYATYAWFRVHPASGRMIGVLPGGAHGAFTDELNRIGGGLLDKVRKKVTDAAGGGSAKAFFSQLAGMYVSAGGIIDAIGMTIADPSLANMGGEAWRKFLALHSLEMCSQFLEDNADTYDNYPTILGFWQGAMIYPSMLGGRDAVKDAARRAVKSVTDKAKKDFKEWAEKQVKQGKKVGREAANEYMAKKLPNVKKVLEGVERVNDALETGKKIGKETAEGLKRVERLAEEFGGS